MNKEERIKRYGEAAYEKMSQQSHDYKAQHREEDNARSKKWHAANPEKAKALGQEHSRKGGKYYEKWVIYNTTGIQGERGKIRRRHGHIYRAIKEATPNSQIHHDWIPGTAKYRGVALVEKEAHEHGIIKVIKVLEGAIT